MKFEFPIRAGASLLVGVALLIAACSRRSSPADSSALKPIDQAALQNMVDTTAKELLVPGALLLLRAPRGEFKVTYGTTQLGTTSPPHANTNYTLLGLIAEKVDGKPMARAMQDRLFGPLGMHDTLLPPRTSNTIPDPYSHGYLYGSSLFVLTDTPYPPDIQAAARAGTLLPTDYTNLNPSVAYFPGGVISTANDLAIWIEALVTGRVFDAAYQRRWLDSLQAKDPSMPNGQQYGYGIGSLRWGPNAVYFHGGETPGYNSHMCYEPNSRVTYVTWTNLPI